MIIVSFSTLFAWFDRMFSSIGLFKQVKCPEESCHLPHCIYCHEPPRQGLNVHSHTVLESNLTPNPLENEVLGEEDQARKRRRLDVDNSNGHRRAFVPDGASSSHPTPKISEHASSYSRGVPLDRAQVSKTLQKNSTTREVSPPPLRRKLAGLSVSHTTDTPHNKGISRADSLKASIKSTPVESLNPRMLHNPPASHAIRTKLVGMLHGHMARLNDEVKKCDDALKVELELSAQGLISRVLAEEEMVAKASPSVYNNIIKLRIVSLKKMKLADWKKERLKHIATEAPAVTQIAPSIPEALSHNIDTGLSPSEEIALLPRLFAKQEGLIKFGYVPAPPSENDILEAKKGVDASQGWEQCDRCRTRFQVFQGRRVEDGALTTGGHCVYHFAKPLRPTKELVGTGHKDPIYPCCNQSISTSVGCTTADSHVYKISDPKRLALILPFMTTPSEPSMKPNKPNTAVCFDCEMGYTTLGMEPIRLTATSWPSGTDLLDLLIRPLGEILDLNSRFSGVWPSHFSTALPYEDQGAERDADTVAGRPLRIAESPMVAREALLKHLTPKTALIGHALENDLNSVRLTHPSIIDTVLLYPHPRGLPVRFGLKMLVKKHLDRDIQMGGAHGHDSREDARAAGDLVRLKLAATWKTMKNEGWTAEDGIFNAPSHLNKRGKAEAICRSN